MCSLCKNHYLMSAHSCKECTMSGTWLAMLLYACLHTCMWRCKMLKLQKYYGATAVELDSFHDSAPGTPLDECIDI